MLRSFIVHCSVEPARAWEIPFPPFETRRSAKLRSFLHSQNSSRASTAVMEPSASPLSRRRCPSKEVKPNSAQPAYLSFHILSPPSDAISDHTASFPNSTYITHADPFVVLSTQEAKELFFEGSKGTRVVRSKILKGGTLFFSKSGWDGTISPYHWLIEL